MTTDHPAGLDLAAIEGRLKDLVEEYPADDTMYGFFAGGDPRRFTPDEDSCSPDEMARWRQACGLWDQGIEVLPAPDVPPSRVLLEDGSEVPLCGRDESFGIGVQKYESDLGRFLRDDMPALLAEVRRLQAVATAAREVATCVEALQGPEDIWSVRPDKMRTLKGLVATFRALDTDAPHGDGGE